MKKFSSAINIFSEISDVDSVCICYRKYIDTSTDYNEQKNALLNFAEYCFKHGRFEQSIIIIQEYLRKSVKFIEIKNAKNLIITYTRDKERYLEEYTTNLEN